MADAYARTVAQMAAAQVCDSLGFPSVQRSALDTLTDVMLRYIQTLGETSHSLAELSGRTEPNLHDVMLALDDMGTSISDLMKFVDYVDEAGPAQPIPRFPVARRTRLSAPSFVQRREEPPRSDIPEWMPVLPDKHTYLSTPVWEQAGRSELQAMQEEGKQRRKAEKSLVRLHQRMEALTAGGYRGAQANSLWGGLPQPHGSADEGPAPAAQRQGGAGPAELAGAGEPEMREAKAVSLMDAFAGALRSPDAKPKAQVLSANVSEEPKAKREPSDAKWSGWVLQPNRAPAAPTLAPAAGAVPLAGAKRVRMEWGATSPVRRKALAVRCRAAVKAADVLGGSSGGPGGEGREETGGRGAKDDEQEEKRRKVEQMLRDAGAAEGGT